MKIEDRLLQHLQQGRPLTRLSARQTFGVKDLRKSLFTLRYRGHHISETKVVTINRWTGEPISVVEFRMEEV